MRTLLLSLGITLFIFVVNLTLYTASAKASQKVASYFNSKDIAVVKTLKAIPEEVKENANNSSVKKLIIRK